jgi:hypothetical protein
MPSHARKSFVTRPVFLTAAAAFVAVAATPALGQAVISNPGYCAQFYPDANCQNKAPNNPYTGDYQRRRAMRGDDPPSPARCAMGAAFYRGRDGHRHYCN